MVTLFGVLVLSIGLVRLVFMADSALADKDEKGDKGGGSSTNLSGVTQNWDKNLPSNSRFTVLAAFGGAAVRDNNTGLVWEQSPEMQNHNWFQALPLCANKIVGGTAGWRLPSVVEIKSLQDMALPSPNINTVFTVPGLVAFNNWWSATTSSTNADDAWIVDIGGRVNGNNKTNGQGLVWCVRGPMNADAY
jgi:hypothetical protein